MEQDQNAQASTTLCLASAIDEAPDPDPTRLFEKLLKRDSFKAKPMPSTLVETAVAANCTSDHTQLKSLVPCLVEALSSDDWATRKAAVETLVVVVDMERDFLSEFKGE
ncbi:hypothetical protein JHK82_024813 [Glycine max]|nr:hypothetical protein JHK85_025421 [Glycine max]KAG5133625.1 hypothetical protein JHK82_024813 [Glycine max]